MAKYHRHATATMLEAIQKHFPPTDPSWSITTMRRTPQVSYYRQDSKLFFRSIHGTLNHILGAEILWWHRLAGSKKEATSDVAALYRLRGKDLRSAWETRISSRRELFARLNHMAEAWEELVTTGVAREGKLEELHASDTAFFDGSSLSSCHGRIGSKPIDDAWFLDSIEYLDTDNLPTRAIRAAALAQVFNHATHHRGQITAAFTRWGEEFPSLDLQTMDEGFLEYSDGLQQQAKAASVLRDEKAA